MELFIRKDLRTCFPTARHTFGEETTCTLENSPNFLISCENRPSTPAPQMTAYGPAEEFTRMRFVFIFAIYN